MGPQGEDRRNGAFGDRVPRYIPVPLLSFWQIDPLFPKAEYEGPFLMPLTVIIRTPLRISVPTGVTDS